MVACNSNAPESCGNVTVRVDGLAASIAIAMSGEDYHVARLDDSPSVRLWLAWRHGEPKTFFDENEEGHAYRAER